MSIYHFSNTPHGTMKSGEKINTLTHFNYICRVGRYKHMKDHREDLSYVSHGNIPDNNPKKFWKTAEKFRRKNGRAYREIRLGLQEELSLDDNIAVIEEFLERSGIKNKHAYSYAIHDKLALFDKDHRNIHVHIMFNEREQEQDRPLALDDYFKRYSTDRNNTPTGGYKMSEYFKSKQSTIDMRQLWEEIVNNKFKEKGLDIQISSKTLKKQREELLHQGKQEEADLLNRQPGPHLGQTYKNPFMLEYIWNRINAIEKQHEEPYIIRDTDTLEDLQGKEDTIELFAYDYVLRKAAHTIQKQRQAINQLLAENATQEQQQIQHPMLITVRDMNEYIQNRLHTSTDKDEITMLTNVSMAISRRKGNDILFSHQIPTIVNREEKLYGNKLLKDFPMFSRKGKTFIKIEETKALKIGDTVTKGKAPVYTITDDEPILTTETVPLYGNAGTVQLDDNLQKLNKKIEKDRQKLRATSRRTPSK